MKEVKVDVAVAGLGPAGAVLLWHSARKGFKVLGVDQRGWNNLWGKPCGDAIGAHHFPQAGLPDPPSSVVRNKVTAIDIYSPSLRVRYRVTGEGYIVDRKGLGRLLVREALDHGAEVLLNASVVEPLVEEGRVTGFIVKTKEGKLLVKARYTVDATGVSRVLARRLPSGVYDGERLDPRDTNIAFREVLELEDAIEEPSILRIYLSKRVAPGGYWWFFPEGERKANVGLGVQGGRGYPHPQKLYLKYIRPRYRVSRVIESAGAPVPTRRPAKTMVGEGFLVIGDAAYTVNPLHGGGMGYSFYSAYLASKAIEEAYNMGSTRARDLWSLNVNYMRSLGAKQASLDLFRMFLQELDDRDIEFGMEKRIIPETDVYDISSTGEVKLTVIDKALIVLRGLRRPTLLAKLKAVADYMSRTKELYRRYPEDPQQLNEWWSQVTNLIREFRVKVLGEG